MAMRGFSQLLPPRRPVTTTPSRHVSQLLAADEGYIATKVYHWSTLATLGLTPVALALSPSALNMPIDSHIGMNYVISDYVPKFIGKAARGPARVVMFGITIITTAGLMRLNLFGPGITETLKTLWRKPEPKSIGMGR